LLGSTFFLSLYICSMTDEGKNGYDRLVVTQDQTLTWKLTMKLIIGNKNYSSWSLRPWLLLSAFDLPFEEMRIPLFVDGFKAEIEKHSAAGKVPVLHDNGLVVWDSLAICEYVSEKYLGGKGWPDDQIMRAEARSCCAEMHSGFATLRNDMPMNCRALGRKVNMTKELQHDISRIDSLWTSLTSKFSAQGPWLFGNLSIADCMFAPVVFRFNTYNPELSQNARKYLETMLAHPKMKLWLDHAVNEVETIEYAEVGKQQDSTS
jgi:glutathione S-transferase